MVVRRRPAAAERPPVTRVGPSATSAVAVTASVAAAATSSRSRVASGRCAALCRTTDSRSTADAAECRRPAAARTSRPLVPVHCTAARGEAAVALFKLLKERRHLLTSDKFPTELIEPLQARLDAIHAEDLGVSLADIARLSSGVGYQRVYDGHDMTLCIFLLRAGATIPLHDHPEMHVYGRLLFGRMRVISFDAPPEPRDDDCECEARLRKDSVLGPSPTTYNLGPHDGNVHELQAIDNCAFFDILTPPYDEDQGRDCRYYKCEARAGRHILVPAEYPGFCTCSSPYRGPAFED